MANYGLKIAKTGHDVSEPDRYMRMTTKYPPLKLKASGVEVGSQVSGNGGFTVEITHNLGYVPKCSVLGYRWDSATEAVISRYTKWNRWIYQGLQVSDIYYYYADTTKLYIKAELSYITDAYTFDLNVMYQICYDEDTLA